MRWLLSLSVILSLSLSVAAQPQPLPSTPTTPSPRPSMGMGRSFPIPMLPAQMTAQGDSLFILRGNKIYRLNAKTLKVLATGELPEEMPPAAPQPPR